METLPIIASRLKYGLAPRVISCVAGLWSEVNKYCLPVQTAAGVIRESGSRVLILHIPKDIHTASDESLSFEELVTELDIPLSEMVLFFNTSLCSTSDEVQQVLETMKYLSSVTPYNKTFSFLKLEVLDEDLYPDDEKICEIILNLPKEVRHVTIPFLTGNIDTLEWVTLSGCPAARIWCSRIGQKQGITDRPRLERAVRFSKIPLILEGGLATPNDVCQALELGFDAVLLNSAFRYSTNPIELAGSIRLSIDNFEKNSRLTQY